MPVTRPPLRACGLLDVEAPHRIHWEESGSPDGVPALYLHGGPGSGLGSGGYRDRFDPSRYRIIGIEQRGCGRSTPSAGTPGYDLDANTTAHLIADIEAVRAHLGVDRWVINGVSWGSTLALAYAQAHPDRVLGVVLMAVTTTSRSEVQWITEQVGAVFPEAWHRLARHLLPDHAPDALVPLSTDARTERPGRIDRPRIIDAAARRMRDPDPAVRDAASRAWAEWEDHHVAIGTGGHRRDPRWEDDEVRLTIATLVTHYWSHAAFCDPPILERMSVLAGIPGILVHGRLDVSGPVLTPWLLHRAWPGSELIIDEGEGHGGARMVDEWTAANARLADRIGGRVGG